MIFGNSTPVQTIVVRQNDFTKINTQISKFLNKNQDVSLDISKLSQADVLYLMLTTLRHTHQSVHMISGDVFHTQSLPEVESYTEPTDSITTSKPVLQRVSSADSPRISVRVNNYDFLVNELKSSNSKATSPVQRFLQEKANSVIEVDEMISLIESHDKGFVDKFISLYQSRQKHGVAVHVQNNQAQQVNLTLDSIPQSILSDMTNIESQNESRSARNSIQHDVNQKLVE